MRILLWGLVFFSLVPCHAADLQSAESVFWEDEAGDVQPWSNRPDQPRPDLIRIDTESANGMIRMTLTFKEPLQKIFDYTDAEGNKYAGTLLNVYIDSDNKAASGGKPNWANEAGRPLEGYDFTVDIALGYVFKTPGTDSSGWAAGDTIININKVQIEKSFGKFSISKINQGSDGRDFSYKNPDISGDEGMKRTQIAGEKLTIELPYEWLGLKAGDTIRLCIRDYQEGAASGKNITQDRWLILK
jgi:hypothetical protein